MEGEGGSTTSNVASAASASGGIGSSFGGGGFESIGAGTPSVGSGSVGVGSSVSVFEAGHQSAPGDAPTVDIVEKEIHVSIGEPASTVDTTEITRIESGVIDAVRKEGTPEAGIRFLSDVPIVDGESIPALSVPEGEDGSVDTISVPESVTESVDDSAQVETPSLTPEQKQVHDFLRSNPEMLTAFGQVLNLGPEAMGLFIKALKKALEEEKQKAKDEEEKKKLSKWEMMLLAFLFLIQLAASAVEKGAKEASR